MKKILSSVLYVSIMLTSVACFATEPTNLYETKQILKRYHDTGAYEKDINDVNEAALSYLKSRVAHADFHGKKPAIVLDIDETSLSNYENMVRLDFGGTIDEIRAAEDKGIDFVIPSTLTLFQYAKAHQVAVIFITGRHEEERHATETNLKAVGYRQWDKLILRDGKQKKLPASTYKTALRKKFTDEGYDIILNMGDQQSDLTGGYADKIFKLPNPYYFIP